VKFLMTYQSIPGAPPPTPEQLQKLGVFTEKHVKAGTVVLTGGLVRPTRGLQLKCVGGKASITDGPFTESKELIDGFALVEVKSKDEAVQIAREFMEVAGDGVGEILQVFEAPPPSGIPAPK
jgi:hypothetical protein